MLTKVIQKNIALSEALVEQQKLKKGVSEPVSGAASTLGAGSEATSATGRATSPGAAQKEGKESGGSDINKKWI